MARTIKSIPVFLFLIFLLLGSVFQTQAQTDSLNTISNAIQIVSDSATQKASVVKENSASEESELNKGVLSDVVNGKKIMWALVLLALGYFAISLILGILNSYAIRNPKYSLSIKRLLPILRITAWTFLFYIIIVGVFNPPAATLLAFFASIGVAIGFAAQDLVKNVFGGLLVMFDRPFQIGDKIETGGHYGEVIEIGIRSTKIVTPDDSVITIPNSDFMSSFVSNSNTGENNCQVVAEIYLPLDIDTEKVRKIAKEAALISKYIYLNKPIHVLFINELHMNRSVYKMRLKAYVSDLSKEFAFKSEMTEIVLKSLLEEKIIQKDDF